MPDRITVPINPMINPSRDPTYLGRLRRQGSDKWTQNWDRAMSGGMGAAGVLSLADLARLKLQGKTPREDYYRERAARKFAETEGQTSYATDRASGKGHKFQGVF